MILITFLQQIHGNFLQLCSWMGYFTSVYILLRRRQIDFVCLISCSEEKFDAGPFSWAGLVNTITWKFFSTVSRDPGIAIPGSWLTWLARLSCNHKVDLCCVQQTRWDLGKPSQACSLGLLLGSCNQALKLSTWAQLFKAQKTYSLVKSLSSAANIIVLMIAFGETSAQAND